jgi:isoleucyl-tRNA synthetase
VLSTHLFNKPAFYNLIVNGLVLAADGKKMSKRLKNYPDPSVIVKDHGADAVRMYMCNSPVVRAEPLKFKEDGVKSVVKDVFLPWYNVYRFFIQEVSRYEGTGTKFVPDSALIKRSTNFMDKWINAGNHGLIQFVKQEMEAYRLYTVVPRLVNFLEDLTNWYVRLNRDRMRGNSGPEEARTALCTLYDVLLNTSVLLAPVTPFITELIYQNISRALPDGHAMKQKSVHWVMMPDFDSEALNPKIIQSLERLQSVVQLGRTCRERKKVGLKTPLKGMKLLNKSEDFIKDIKSLEAYLKDELNVRDLSVSTDTSKVILEPTLNFRALGKKLGKDMKQVQEASKSLSTEDLQKFDAEGKITICGYELCRNDEDPDLSEMTVTPKVKDLTDENFLSNGDKESLVILDFTPDEDLEMDATCRTISNNVQKLRKEAKLQVSDAVDMFASVQPAAKSSAKLQKVINSKQDEIERLLRRPLWDGKLLQGHEIVVAKEEFEIEGDKLVVTITSTAPFFNADALKKLSGGDAGADQCARQLVQTLTLQKLLEAKTTPLKMVYNSKEYSLKYGDHWTLGPTDASWVKRAT